MNNGSIKIMTIIAVILQALATVLGLGVLSIVSVFGSVLVNIFYSRQGAAALGAYSSITTLINYVNTLLVIPAEALFYIACGRYTAK